MSQVSSSGVSGVCWVGVAAAFIVMCAAARPPAGWSSSAPPPARQGPVLPSGTRIAVRLLDAVVGLPAAKGATVRVRVIAPVSIGGRLALATGDTIAGSVTDAGVQVDRGQRYFVSLKFSRLSLSTGSMVPVEATVADVPDARETVDTAGRILGPEQPGALRSRGAWIAELLGAADPLAGAVFYAAFRREDDERHRRIEYAPGVELTLRLTAALSLDAWPLQQEVPPAAPVVLTALAEAPLHAVTARDHVQADVITLALVGSEAEVTESFRAAGWTTPERSSIRAALKTLAAAARGSGFDAQPVSTLELDGRSPTLAFEKVVNSMAKRHHLRIWPWGTLVQGRQLWLVAATRDDGILLSRARRTFTHRVDPHIDVERQKVVDDLSAAGAVTGQSFMSRTVPTQVLVNDGATPVVTDWRLAVLVLRHGALPSSAASPPPPS